MEDYPYTAAWKAAVDKASDEWRGYCEALSLVKRYFQIERDEGKAEAVRDYKTTIGNMQHDDRSKARVARLDRDFRLIGWYEADLLRPQN